jgi:hypothetical protein
MMMLILEDRYFDELHGSEIKKIMTMQKPSDLPKPEQPTPLRPRPPVTPNTEPPVKRPVETPTGPPHEPPTLPHPGRQGPGPMALW